jgi:hypothetical protein
LVVLAETQRVEVAGGADDHLNEFDGKRADIVPLLQAYDPLNQALMWVIESRDFCIWG